MNKYRIKRFFDDLDFKRRGVRWFIQRGRRGYGDIDVWNFYSYHTEVVIGVIKQLREGHGYPGDLTAESWDEILEKIQKGFEAAKALEEDYSLSEPQREELQKVFDTGFSLLHERYSNLWD